MSFEISDHAGQVHDRVRRFMEDHVYPAEAEYDAFRFDPANRWVAPPLMEELKARARAEGLWNLFLPNEYEGFSPGLSNLEYAPIAETMGRVMWASEAFNCSAPDTGNMEVLARYGTPEQQARWLTPLMAGEIRFRPTVRKFKTLRPR